MDVPSNHEIHEAMNLKMNAQLSLSDDRPALAVGFLLEELARGATDMEGFSIIPKGSERRGSALNWSVLEMLHDSSRKTRRIGDLNE
jgi:hypothetical protein